METCHRPAIARSIGGVAATSDICQNYLFKKKKTNSAPSGSIRQSGAISRCLDWDRLLALSRSVSLHLDPGESAFNKASSREKDVRKNAHLAKIRQHDLLSELVKQELFHWDNSCKSAMGITHPHPAIDKYSLLEVIQG